MPDGLYGKLNIAAELSASTYVRCFANWTFTGGQPRGKIVTSHYHTTDHLQWHLATQIFPIIQTRSLERDLSLKPSAKL